MSLNQFALSPAVAVLFAATLSAATTPVTITATYITPSTHVLTVYGSGFAPRGAAPIVMFGGRTLGLKSFTNFAITATLPPALKQGTYPVTIRNCEGQSATVSTSFDYDAPLVTDSTLQGNGTSAAPLGIKIPLTLFSDLGPTLTVESLAGDAVDAFTQDGQVSVFGGGPNTGIYGIGCCNPGSNGVVGDSGGQPGGTGVYGIGGSEPGVDAGFFAGDVEITGKLTKGGGSFRIDHPIDPANKYLSHSFVESPDMMNIYNGNVMTDATGIAAVTLPDWFQALNRDSGIN